MNILFATPEAAPFVKSGGLGDVAGSLPAEIVRISNNNVCVVLPYYRSVKYGTCSDAEYVGNIFVPLAWRNVYAGVFRKTLPINTIGNDARKSINYYFIDNEYYFGRGNLYGEIDDVERFAFFSKAVLEAIPLMGFEPDVVHANDWQCGFIPLFLKAHYSHIPMYQKIRTVFTIHNIEYQGKADMPFLTDVLGVGQEFHNVCIFDGLVNAMKTAIVLCDKLTTVSETYSHEITYPYYACGLSSIINENRYKLSGIVNGIDTDAYSPQKDIPYPYTKENIRNKRNCKRALQKELGLNVRGDVPLFVMVSRLVKHKGLELLEAMRYEIMAEDIQLAVLGTGDERFEYMLNRLSTEFPQKMCSLITFDSPLAKRLYAGGDFLLMPSAFEPCGLSQLIAMRYGTVPIVRETGGLVDTVPAFDPVTGDGRGITFKLFNAHEMLYAIKRAEALFHDSSLMPRLRKKIMNYDVSWKNGAKKYCELYLM